MIDPTRLTRPDLFPAKVRVIAIRDQAPVPGHAGTALLYLRCQQNPDELSDQRAICRAAADRLGARVVGEFSDIASAAARRRPGFAGLVEYLLTASGLDYVIVDRLDRLARSSHQFLAVAHLMGSRGVTLATAG